MGEIMNDTQGFKIIDRDSKAQNKKSYIFEKEGKQYTYYQGAAFLYGIDQEDLDNEIVNKIEVDYAIEIIISSLISDFEFLESRKPKKNRDLRL